MKSHMELARAAEEYGWSNKIFFSSFQVTFDKVGRKKECVVFSKERESERGGRGGDRGCLLYTSPSPRDA